MEFRGDVVGVAEGCVDAIEKATASFEASDDLLDGGFGVASVIVSKASLTAVGVAGRGGDRVDGPDEFAECAITA